MTKAFHLMAKPTSYQCNMACDYCFYLEKSKLFQNPTLDKHKPDHHKITAMSDEVLRGYIKQFIASQDRSVIDFAWQGGEPTTAGLAFFEKVIKYQQKFSQGKQINNSIQTNGLLLNDQWCSFLKDNNFLVGVSVDGPEKIHDKYRLSSGGKTTFSRVMKGIEHLKKHDVEFNTLTVVNNINAKQPLEVYRFLKDIGSTFQQFIPIVEQTQIDTPDPILIFPSDHSEKSLMPFSVDGEEYGDFMITIFDEWVRNDVGRFYIQLFESTLASWFGVNSSLCLFQKECGDCLVVERNGDIYSCDHYVYPEYRLGNLLDTKLNKMVESKQQKKFALEKSNVGTTCQQCQYLFACHGGCPKHRIHPNTDGTRQNHLCSGYLKYFNHVAPYMRYMAEQVQIHRSPASVMPIADQIKAANQTVH
ncbi:anaerobic sulfatase maturase [Endozoicomonas ascidiicola]|uniref:anaerobic sulfatase maturase n=1 Tax=Endozoicomonas ascidiicola TaxID=1698521 RepID=UPI00082E8621|nr:anaerobic sulfatase maturase [Endozoicomonas ascidiicola]